MRESRTPGSVRAKAEWLSYSTTTVAARLHRFPDQSCGRAAAPRGRSRPRSRAPVDRGLPATTVASSAARECGQDRPLTRVIGALPRLRSVRRWPPLGRTGTHNRAGTASHTRIDRSRPTAFPRRRAAALRSPTVLRYTRVGRRPRGLPRQRVPALQRRYAAVRRAPIDGLTVSSGPRSESGFRSHASQPGLRPSPPRRLPCAPPALVRAARPPVPRRVVVAQPAANLHPKSDLGVPSIAPYAQFDRRHQERAGAHGHRIRPFQSDIVPVRIQARRESAARGRGSQCAAQSHGACQQPDPGLQGSPPFGDSLIPPRP